MTDLFLVFSVLFFLSAASYLIYHRPIDAARRALHDALERGDIRPDQYAAHVRALEDAA